MKKYKQQLLLPKHRGIVLLITLLVLVAMMLASVGIMRSVDTSTGAIGNLAFRQAADMAVNSAVENVIRNLPGWTGGANFNPNALDNNNQGNGYYASIQPNESAQGVPLWLQTPVSVGNVLRTADAAGNITSIMVERMCNAAGAASAASCLQGPATPGGNGGGTNKVNERGKRQQNNSGIMTYYRISVRVDGPNNTVSFAQAMIGY